MAVIARSNARSSILADAVFIVFPVYATLGVGSIYVKVIKPMMPPSLPCTRAFIPSRGPYCQYGKSGLGTNIVHVRVLALMAPASSSENGKEKLKGKGNRWGFLLHSNDNLFLSLASSDRGFGRFDGAMPRGVGGRGVAGRTYATDSRSSTIRRVPPFSTPILYPCLPERHARTSRR